MRKGKNKKQKFSSLHLNSPMVYPRPKAVSRTAMVVASLPGNMDMVTDAIMAFKSAAEATPTTNLQSKTCLG